MEKKFDMKNTFEVLDALEVLAVKLLQIAKDGLKADDIPKVMELLGQAEKIELAVKDVALVKDEMLDVDKEEAQQLIARLYDLANAIAKARA